MRSLARMCAFLLPAMTMALPAKAQPAPETSPPAQTAVPQAARASLPPLPWDKDFAVLPAAQADLQKGGLKALAPHVQDFQTALDDGKQYFPDGAAVDGKRYVLVDGPTESLGAMIKSAAVQKGVPVVAMRNAYPVIALDLGLYYDEVGRPEDALYVLNEGLALSPMPDAQLGTLAGRLLGEKGYALNMLKRYDEALAFFEKSLANKSLSPTDRALLYRGRGFTLTELNQLDEAEIAYKTSLDLEPHNPQALREIEYIARLRAGGDKKPIKTFTTEPNSSSEPPPSP